MKSHERGSAEWVREQSDFIAYEIILIIDAALEAVGANRQVLPPIHGSINTDYKQIDVEYVNDIILAYTAKTLNIPIDCCFAIIDYDRDYDVNQDYFKFEIITSAS